MKTTIELSDLLFEQAKESAKAQGITLRSLVERGLRLAMLPKEQAGAAGWGDLTFHPAEPGCFIPASQWRDELNATPGFPVTETAL